MMEAFIEPKCFVCGHDDATRQYAIQRVSCAVPEKLKLKHVPAAAVVKCNVCQHRYASPVINEVLMKKYYEQLDSEYFGADKGRFRDHVEKRHEVILSLVQKECARGGLLEIGCGNGILLKKFQNSGWDVLGIEPSPGASKFAAGELGLDVRRESFDSAALRGQLYDAVLLFDVIEHLHNPNQIMQGIRQILKPTGALFVGTGNIESVNARLGKTFWGYFDSFEHISFFSPGSIKHLLARHGLLAERMIKVSYNGGFLQNSAVFSKSLIKNTAKYFMNMCSPEKYKYSFPIAFDHLIAVARSDS